MPENIVGVKLQVIGSIDNISKSDDILYAKNKNISSGTLFDLNTIKKNRKLESNI